MLIRSFFFKSAAIETTTCFSDLPDDVVKEILHRLDLASIQKFYRLSRRYHNLIYQSFRASPVLKPIYDQRDNALSALYQRNPYSLFFDKHIIRLFDYFSFLLIVIGGVIFSELNQQDYHDRDSSRRVCVLLISLAIYFGVMLAIPSLSSYLTNKAELFLKEQENINTQFLGLFNKQVSKHKFIDERPRRSQLNAS